MATTHGSDCGAVLAAVAAATAVWLAWPTISGEPRGALHRGVRDVALLALVAVGWGWWAAVVAAVVLRGLAPWWERRSLRTPQKLDATAAVPLTVALAVCHSAGAIGVEAWRQAALVVGPAAAGVCDVVVQSVEHGARYPTVLGEVAEQHPQLAGLCQVLSRAHITGAPATPTLMELTRQQGAQAHSQRLQRVRQLGVKAALPLGLCFLPAFILLGVVPIAAGFL